MASSANPCQESRTQFGEFAPVSSTNSKIQKQSGQSAPFSPQLRYSLSRKQPRIRVSPPSSSSNFSPSPKTVASIVNGSYYKVPSIWCPDNRVWSRDLYLSRNSLLKKMIHQRILYRILLSNADPSNVNHELAMEKLGSPFDYWVTIPIQPPTRLQNADPPELKDVCLDKNNGISIAYATGPAKLSWYALHRLVGYGREPDNGGIPFPWVKNTTGTKFLDRGTIISSDIKEIVGFVECRICGSILCIGYLVPGRFDKVDKRLDAIGVKISTDGDKYVRESHLICRCDGNENLFMPLVSVDLNKINWMFLFLGFGIGFCYIDELEYYCKQRNLPISGDKTDRLLMVFDDLCQQIFERQVPTFLHEDNEPVESLETVE